MSLKLINIKFRQHIYFGDIKKREERAGRKKERVRIFDHTSKK
jgi:hypothetical protein